mgnify:CR=1 FL=1
MMRNDQNLNENMMQKNFLNILFVCSQYIKTCEFALFLAQILPAVAANTVGLQACSLYKMRTLGHSL